MWARTEVEPAEIVGIIGSEGGRDAADLLAVEPFSRSRAQSHEAGFAVAVGTNEAKIAIA